MENELELLRELDELRGQSNRLVSALIATILIETDADILEMTKEEVETFLESLIEPIWVELDERSRV